MQREDSYIHIDSSKNIKKKFIDYFNDLWNADLKKWLSVASFSMGSIIACICLFKIDPIGEIANTAITIVSMFLVLAGAFIGIDVSFDIKMQKMKSELMEKMNVAYEDKDNK